MGTLLQIYKTAEILQELSEGFPGALIALKEICMHQEKVRIIKLLFKLDIKGKKLSNLWNEECEGNINKFIMVILEKTNDSLQKESGFSFGIQS